MGMGASRVIWSFNDLSLYVDVLSKGYVIALIQAERGPLWTPVPVTSVDEYERWFGRTFPGSTDPLVLKMGLMQGAKFLVIRTLHCTDTSDPTTMTAVASTLTMTDRGASANAGAVGSAAGPFSLTQTLSGRVTGTEVEPFSFGTGSSDQFKVTIGAGVAQTFTLTGSLQSAQAVCDQINAATTDLTASPTTTGKIKLVANVVTNALEIVTVATNAYSVLGFSLGAHAAVTGTDTLIVAIDAGANQTFTLLPAYGEEGAFSLTAGQASLQVQGLTGASVHVVDGALWITSDTTGTNSKVEVKTASTADVPMGFDNAVHSGSAAGSALATLKIDAKDPGVWGDALKVTIYDSPLNKGIRFDMRITYTNQGGLNEYHADMNMDPESDRYAVEYINTRSRLARATDMDSANPAPNNLPAIAAATSLTGGNDGLVGFTDADWIGDELAHTGIYAADLIREDSLDFILPGSTSFTVAQALTAYCEDRSFIGYMMVPEGLDPEDALAWRNGDDPWTFEKWNNPHLVLEFGRPTCYDARYDAHRQISNLGLLAACLSKTDVYYDYSHSPVGPRRGTVQMVEGLDWNLYDFPGYQDEFSDNQMNYLEMTKSEGAVFWEDHTTLIVASSMRRLSVMRFLLAMKKMFMPVLRTFIKEPNHPKTWGELHRVLEPQLMLWKDQGSIYSYLLQTDRAAYFDDSGELKGAIINTGHEIQQGIYNARVLLQPTLPIDWLQFTVGVLATGEPYVNYEFMHTLPGWIRR